MSDMCERNESNENITEIVHTITEMVQPEQIILFGSRVHGTAHRYSDYDTALVGMDMDHRMERHLKDALDNRLGVFNFDLVNVDAVDPEFKDIIVRDGMIVYESRRPGSCAR